MSRAGDLDPAALAARLDAFAGVRLLVVGDLVLDEYVRGDARGTSPEAPVPVVRVGDEGVSLGGAANVARNVLALGGQVALCCVVGDDPAGRRAAGLLEEIGVDTKSLVVAEGRTTPRKTRVVVRHRPLLRLDREDLAPVPEPVGRRLLAAVERQLGSVDAVVVEDYGKGTFAGEVAAATMRRFRRAGLPVAVDPKATLAPYRGAALLKPNLREAESLSGIAIRGPADLLRAGGRLREEIGGGAVVMTRGAAGAVLFDAAHRGVAVPAVPRRVLDVQGAGDTYLAALVLSLRAGASLFEAAVLANAAAGIAVGKVGTAAVGASELRARLPAALRSAGGTP